MLSFPEVKTCGKRSQSLVNKYATMAMVGLNRRNPLLLKSKCRLLRLFCTE
jgi:hypothetical protein